MLKKSIIRLLALVLLTGAMPVSAYAAPSFTFSPSSGSIGVGSTLVVVMGVNSESEKVNGIDISGTFDAAKMKIKGVTAVSSPAYNFDTTGLVPNISEDTGRFSFVLSPKNPGDILSVVAVNGPLVNIILEGKATGTAALNLTCTQGSTADTNIVNDASQDVVNCSSNQSGSYTITGGTGGENTTPTPTVNGPTNTIKPTTTGQLPKTGGVESTIGLAIFGIIGLSSALFLKWL